MTANDWIAALGLAPHPEGGWFRETYRAAEAVGATHLPPRYGGPRPFSTAIYFLLGRGDVSRLHRIRSDEIWHFHAGDALALVALHGDGRLEEHRLGLDAAAGERPQAVVPAGAWFGGWVPSGGYALVGCTVAPGFDFDDLELGDRARLLAAFPQHEALVERLT